MQDVLVTPQFKPEAATTDAGSNRIGVFSQVKNNDREQGFAKVFANTLDIKRVKTKPAPDHSQRNTEHRTKGKKDSETDPSSNSRSSSRSTSRPAESKSQRANLHNKSPHNSRHNVHAGSHVSEKNKSGETFDSDKDGKTLPPGNISGKADGASPAATRRAATSLRSDAGTAEVDVSPDATRATDTVAETGEPESFSSVNLDAINAIEKAGASIPVAGTTGEVLSSEDTSADPLPLIADTVSTPSLKSPEDGSGTAASTSVSITLSTVSVAKASSTVKANTTSSLTSGIPTAGALTSAATAEGVTDDTESHSQAVSQPDARAKSPGHEASAPSLAKLIEEQTGKLSHREIADQRLKSALKESHWKELVTRSATDNGLQMRQVHAEAKLDALPDPRQPTSSMLYDKLFAQATQPDAKPGLLAAANGTSHLLAESELLSGEMRLNDSEVTGLSALAGHRVSAPATSNLMPMLQLNNQIQHPAWSHDMGNKLMFMIKQDIQQAQLQLNPQHLGPLEVRISVGQDQQVNVMFTAQHASVRDALDGAMTRLRDMLEEQGFSLNEFNVSDQAHKQHRDETTRDHFNRTELSGYDEPDDISIPEILPGSSIVSDKLVDYFA